MPQVDDFDESFIRLAKQGDASAIAAIVKRYHAYLIFIANEELGNSLAGRFAPSDAVQDTLIGLREKLTKFRGVSESELKAWLRSSLKNVIKNARRDQGRQKRDAKMIELFSGCAVDSDTPSKRLRTEEEYSAIAKVLDLMNDREREILRMRHESGLTFSEIGKAIGISSDAARMAWMRAVEKVRNRLTEDMTATDG